MIYNVCLSPTTKKLNLNCAQNVFIYLHMKVNQVWEIYKANNHNYYVVINMYSKILSGPKVKAKFSS